MAELLRESRLVALFKEGKEYIEIAADPAVRKELEGRFPTVAAQRLDVWNTLETLILRRALPRRKGSSAEAERETIRLANLDYEAKQETIELREAAQSDYGLGLRQTEIFEQFVALSRRRRTAKRPPTTGRVNSVVIGDPHCPEERMDLVERIAARHRGEHLVLAGDLNDLEKYGRWEVEKWDLPTIQNVFAHTDRFLQYLSDQFETVTVMFGNHDLRLPKTMTRALGSDYHYIGHEFLTNTVRNRHGVHLIEHTVPRASGHPIPGVHYYHQLGDCLVSHAECAGSTPAKGSLQAVKHFQMFKRELGLAPFSVLLQAHTHKQSYFREPIDRIHCYEIGCVCDVPAYTLRKHTYQPPQYGYFHLVQDDGVTDLDQSRLYTFE